MSTYRNAAGDITPLLDDLLHAKSGKSFAKRLAMARWQQRGHDNEKR